MTAQERPKPLRVAFIVGGTSGFENWELMIFDRILADPRFELAALLVHPHPDGVRKAPAYFTFASRVEKALLVREPAYRPSLFTRANVAVEQLRENGDADAALLRKHRLHLAVRLVAEGLEDAAIQALPLGEWAFSFSDMQSGGVNWYAYDELGACAPTIPLKLVAEYGDGRPPRLIAECRFNTRPSAALATAAIKERAVTLLMRELGCAADDRAQPNAPIVPFVPPGPPSLANLAGYGLALTARLTRRVTKAAKSMTGTGSAVWTLYTGAGTIESFDPERAVEIPPAKGDIRADPFLFEHEGDCFLFYEGYASGDRKAHIAVARLKGDEIEPLGVALDCPGHLSYPFVFEHDGSIYMMPETHQSGRIEIWRSTEFPLKWELHATALEGHSPVDSVLVPHAGTWWLFTNMSEHFAHEDHCAELHVFQVDGPDLKDLVPHRNNPVVMGSETARNGGRIVERGGRLLRPAQINANGTYGYGLKIMEITELSLEVYRERCIRTIEPDFKPGLVGCHHFDAAGGRYILDARLTA